MNEEERIEEIKNLRDMAIQKRNPWYVSTGVYISDVTYLLERLSESQRREKAAESCLTDLGAIDDDSLYDDDISSIAWKVLTKWRGQQDEKGE